MLLEKKNIFEGVSADYKTVSQNFRHIMPILDKQASTNLQISSRGDWGKK